MSYALLKQQQFEGSTKSFELNLNKRFRSCSPCKFPITFQPAPFGPPLTPLSSAQRPLALFGDYSPSPWWPPYAWNCLPSNVLNPDSLSLTTSNWSLLFLDIFSPFWNLCQWLSSQSVAMSSELNSTYFCLSWDNFTFVMIFENEWIASGENFNRLIMRLEK